MAPPTQITLTLSNCDSIGNRSQSPTITSIPQVTLGRKWTKINATAGGLIIVGGALFSLSQYSGTSTERQITAVFMAIIGACFLICGYNLLNNERNEIESSIDIV